MLKSAIGDTAEVHQAILDEFKIQEDVKMYIQLPDYDDFLGFYLPSESALAAISNRAYAGFLKMTWSTLKHHLLSSFTPKKLLRPHAGTLRARYKGAFKQGILFLGISNIRISRTFNGLVEMDFADDGEEATFPHIQDTFSRYPPITISVAKKKKGGTSGKAAQSAFANWVRFPEHRVLF